jgi:hypothetical protein
VRPKYEDLEGPVVFGGQPLPETELNKHEQTPHQHRRQPGGRPAAEEFADASRVDFEEI